MAGDTKKPPLSGRWRLVMMVLGAVLLVQVIAAVMLQPLIPSWAGHDFILYRDAASRWLATGQFYSPYQLAEPYPIVADEILYPPVALWLLVPFTVLPQVLWVIAPIGIVAAVLVRSRPSPTRWAVVLFLVTFPQWRPVSFTLDLLILGNPTIWVAAFVALATRFPAFGPFALLKPVPALIPFSLVGVWSRWWWVGLAAFAGMSLVLLPMWFDYLTVLRNAQGGGFTYSLASVPVVLIGLCRGPASEIQRRGRAVVGESVDADVLPSAKRGPRRPVQLARLARVQLRGTRPGRGSIG